MHEDHARTGRIEGKVALITGAASGIGEAVAILFAREGARVALADLDLEGARRAARDIAAQSGAALALALDVTSAADWQRAVDELLNAWGRLDVLVNNAGIGFAKPLTEMTYDEWRKVMAINLDGVFMGTQQAMRVMRQQQGGSIVNVASASGIKASAGASAYATSKAAVRMFSRAAALEGAAAGVRVNTVSPGGVRTPMWEEQAFWQSLKEQAGSAEAAWRSLAEGVPLGRFAAPAEVAQAILYLASDESRFVTAADLVIDGGYTA